MPIPNFVQALRKKIGHDPLWLPGVAAVVFDDDGRVLLGRRADDGRWTLVSGMVEPGEHPAPAMIREIEEETGVVAEVDRLIDIDVVGPITFPNGDVCTFLTTTFRCRYISGEARVNDDESTDVGWFSPDALPELDARHMGLIDLAQIDSARNDSARNDSALNVTGAPRFQR